MFAPIAVQWQRMQVEASSRRAVLCLSGAVPFDWAERTARDALSLCPSIGCRCGCSPAGVTDGSSSVVSAFRSDLPILLCLVERLSLGLNCCECWPVWLRANDTVLCVCIFWLSAELCWSPMSKTVAVLSQNDKHHMIQCKF